MKYTIAFLLTLIGWFDANGQVDSKNPGLVAFQKSVDLFRNTKKFSLDVEYAVFFDNIDFSNPDDKSLGKILRDDNNFFQDEMGNIKVLNKNYALILNSNARVITIGDRKETELVPESTPLDSLAKYFVSSENIEGGYRYFTEDEAIDKIDILLGNNGFLKSIRMHYRHKMDFGDGPKKVVTQLTYRNFAKNPKLSGSEFSVSRYVTINKNNEVSLNSAYKNYFLINNIQTP